VSGRQVHSIVAAGLADPRLLARWAADAGALAKLGIVPEEFDVGALRKFAGLTTIVRHNGLRQDLPRTFQLLSEARIEIDLFADYAVHLADAERRLAPGAAARAAEFAEFIGHWIDPGRPAHLLIHDVVRHEVAILLLGADAVAPSAQRGPPCTAAVCADTIAAVRGVILLRDFHFDPRSADPEPMPDRLMLGYWRASATDPLLILELDTFTYELLRRAGGTVSVAKLAHEMTGASPTRRFLAALEEVVALGVITLATP
jgi:hypothetical protein